MARFLGAFNNGGENAKKAITNFMDNILEFIKNMNPDFEKAGNDFIKWLIEGIEKEENSVKNKFNSIINSCVTIIRNKYSDFKKSGEELFSKFVKGISDKYNSTENPFSSILSNLITSIKSRKEEFYNAAKYLCDGFINGITDKLDYVQNVGNELGNRILKGAKVALEEHSPSKKMYEIGEYGVLGLINALNDYQNRTYNAGENIADAASDGVSGAISKISDMLNGDISFDPTIRPILDLSDVKNGVSHIDGILGSRRSFQLAARTSIGADLAIEKRQNSSNSDVVNAISVLREDLSELKGVVGNLKVVMDGDALVGQISNRMDKVLGTKSVLAKRGI